MHSIYFNTALLHWSRCSMVLKKTFKCVSLHFVSVACLHLIRERFHAILISYKSTKAYYVLITISNVTKILEKNIKLLIKIWFARVVRLLLLFLLNDWKKKLCAVGDFFLTNLVRTNALCVCNSHYLRPGPKQYVNFKHCISFGVRCELRVVHAPYQLIAPHL